jgi:hypothetical protein
MTDLILLALAFVAGLIVGWNFLRQPEWVAGLIDEVRLFLRGE